MIHSASNILIVDDAPIIVARLYRLLATVPGDYIIRSAGSHRLALQSLQNQRPDFVLLDINLPDGNGMDLLRHIKSRDPSIIVVMLTNQTGDLYRLRCKALGADYFMDKSADFDCVPHVLSSLLRTFTRS